MNKAIKRVFYLSLGALLALTINLTYLQVFAAEKISQNPANRRGLLRELTIPRGKIVSSDGVVLAANEKVGENYFRVYPEKDIVSNVVGFNNIKYGRSGLELTFNDTLLGKKEVISFDDLIKQATERQKGHDITLTLNLDLQKKATAILGNQKGAIVVINPKTGEVLSLVTSPRYDPNDLEERWSKIATDPDAPLINRTNQGVYPPGSVFKVLTAAAALQNEIVTSSSVYQGPQELKVYGGKVTNYKDQGFGEMPFSEAFAVSCNTIFAQVGLKLGATKFVQFAEKCGFNQEPDFDLPTKASTIPSPFETDKLELAWSAVGQGRISVTPFEMALIGCSVANRGVLMRPYLVKEVRKEGQIIKQFEPESVKRIVSKDVASTMLDLMVGVVEEGTGKRAQIDGVKVAGKTGTAETAVKGQTHAWFLGVAPADDPEVVVVVIVEKGGMGGQVAAPLAKQVIEEALKEK